MRRKFILVGLLLVVFVFPYVLNIGESSAEGLGCPNSLGIGEKIRCLESTLREQNVIVRNLEKSIAESGQARVVLSSQLNDCRMDSPSTNHGTRPSNVIPIFWGKSTPSKEKGPLPKQEKNYCKAKFAVDRAMKHAGTQIRQLAKAVDENTRDVQRYIYNGYRGVCKSRGGIRSGYVQNYHIKTRDTHTQEFERAIVLVKEVYTLAWPLTQENYYSASRLPGNPTVRPVFWGISDCKASRIKQSKFVRSTYSNVVLAAINARKILEERLSSITPEYHRERCQYGHAIRIIRESVTKLTTIIEVGKELRRIDQPSGLSGK